jgi:capsular exopolysaccharide synthesis family protein
MRNLARILKEVKPPSGHAAPRRAVEARGAGPSRELEPISLAEIFLPLRRRWITVVSLAVFCSAAALLIGLREAPTYEATAQLEIEGVNEDFLNMRDLAPTSSDRMLEPYIQTQLKILESPELLQRVADKLNLASRDEFRNASAWTFLSTGGAAPNVKEQVLRQLERQLTVRVAGETHVIEVICESNDPKLASDLANTLSQEYIDLTAARRLSNTSEMARGLAGQLQELKVNLTRSEEALQEYARRSGLLDLSETNPNSTAETSLRLAQESFSKARDERILEQSRFERAVSSPAENLPEVLDDATLRGYATKLTDLRQEAANLSATLKPSHYKIKEVQAQITVLEAAIERARSSIVKRLKNQFEAAQNRERQESASYSRQAAIVAEQAGKSVHYATLKREVDTNRQLYESMEQKVKEAGIVSAVRSANVQLLSAAAVPDLPFKPILPLYGAAGLLVGLFLGITTAFLRTNGQQRIRAADDAMAQLGLPELAVIPYAPALNGGAFPRGVPEWSDSGANQGETWNQLEHPIRTAVASVLLSAPPGRQPRAIAVTSALPGEGKTTVATNFAIALAQTKQRVLLIDGNLRNPRLHAVFGLENTGGMSALLEDLGARARQPIAPHCEQTSVPGLYVLPAGEGGDEMANRLYSPKLAHLFEGLKREFDAIVIDTAPLSELDSRPLARVADGVVLVVAAHGTSQETALAALRRLAGDGTNVLGTIVNHRDTRRARSRRLHMPFYAAPESSYESV